MAINKITLETDGLVVGDNQLLAQGGGIRIGKSLLVEGNTYVRGVIQFADGTTQNTAGATGGAASGIDNTARVTANSKTFAYYQGSAPPATQARDIWINSETGFVYENFGTLQNPIWAEFGPVTGSSVSYNTVSSVAFTSANIYGSIVLGGLAPMFTSSITLSGAMYDSNTAIESYIWNKSNGTFASGDFVAYSNNGSDSSGWLNFGINSSNYNQTSYSSTGPNEGYILMSAPSGSGTSGNLVFVTDSTGTYNSIEFYTGGFNKSKGSAAVAISGNNLKVVDGFASNTITSNSITAKDVTLSGNLTATSLTISSGFNVTVPNLSINGFDANTVNVTTDLTSTQIRGSDINITGNTRTNLLAVNTSITGTDITLTGRTITQALDVNSAITGTDLLLQSSLITNTLRSNSFIGTTNIVASNSVTTGILTSNSNTYVGGTLFVTGDSNITGVANVTGNLIVNSSVVTSNLISVNYTPSTTTGTALSITGANTKGGTGYNDFLSVTNTSGGATNPIKWFRLNNTGAIEIINSGYSSSLLTLDDSGNLSVPGNLTSAGVQSGYNVNRPAFRVYGGGTTNNLSTTQNGTGALTANNWTVDFNQGSYLNGTTGVFTAPVAGLYQINMSVRNSGNGASIMQASLVKNATNGNGSGGSIALMIEFAPSSTMNHTGAGTILKLSVNDTLALKVTAGTITFDSNDSWSLAYIG